MTDHRATSRELAPRLVLVGAVVMAGFVYALPARATFPGRNGQIAVSRRASAIFVVNPSGGREKRVSNARVSSPTDPDWSPDGRTIAFAAYPAGGGQLGVYTVSRRGRQQRRVIGGGASAPAWAPDGRQLAFVRPDGLWKARADGRRAKRLLASGAGVSFSSPSWSPRGDRIVFAVLRPDPAGSDVPQSFIDSIDIRSRSTNELTTSGADYTPDWAPDGRRIAFHSHRPSANGIYLMNADGSGQRALPNSALDHDPAWSPDGKRILFTRYPVSTGTNRVFTTRLDGTGLGVVTGRGFPLSADWGPRSDAGSATG